MPRPQRPRLPAVAIPTPWPAIGRFIDRIRSREFWALTRERGSGTGRDYTRFTVLLIGFSMVALITFVVVIIASLVSGDGSGSPATPFDSPSQTAEPTSTEPAGQVGAPWIDAQMLRDDPLTAATILEGNTVTTGVPQFGTAARHIRQAVADDEPLAMDWLCAIVDFYNTEFSTGESGTLVCTGEFVTPQPVTPRPAEEAISLAVWAGETVGWLFDDLTESVATYREGDEIPFLLTWEAAPGDEYPVEITYDCSVGGVPAIDFLAGVESADADIFEAPRGPGETTPDAAVPLPDTPDLDSDDGSVRLVYLYGGGFLLLPEGPHPADGCSGQRTISFLVRAEAEEMILLGSLRLADSEDHRGLGAADVATSIGFSASVDGIGEASVELERGTVVP